MIWKVHGDGMFRGVFAFLVMMACCGQAAAAQERAVEQRPPLIVKIEELTGIPVTLTQREAIAEASQEMRRALRERQRAFVAELKKRGTIPTRAQEALTPVDGLPFDFDQDALAVIAEHADEPPDQRERDTIRYLEREKDEDLEGIRAQYATALSGITDLPAHLIRELLGPAGVKEQIGETEGAVRFPRRDR